MYSVEGDFRSLDDHVSSASGVGVSLSSSGSVGGA